MQRKQSVVTGSELHEQPIVRAGAGGDAEFVDLAVEVVTNVERIIGLARHDLVAGSRSAIRLGSSPTVLVAIRRRASLLRRSPTSSESEQMTLS